MQTQNLHANTKFACKKNDKHSHVINTHYSCSLGRNWLRMGMPRWIDGLANTACCTSAHDEYHFVMFSPYTYGSGATLLPPVTTTNTAHNATNWSVSYPLQHN